MIKKGENDIKLGAIDDVDVESEVKRKRPPSKAPARSSAAATSSSGTSSDLVLKAGLGIMAVVVLGLVYVLVQLNSQLSDYSARFDKEFATLDDRIAVTDQTLNQSASERADLLKLHDHEIRKLWDLSNKANKPAIATNKANLAKFKKDQAAKAKGLDTKLDSLQTDLRKLSTQLTQMDTRLIVVVDVQKQLQGQIAEQGRTIAKLERESGDSVKAELDRISKSVGEIRKQLEPRIGAAEEAISAIDAHRRKLNQQIEDIRKQQNGVTNP